MTDKTFHPLERHSFASSCLLSCTALLGLSSCGQQPVRAAEHGAMAATPPTAAVCVLRAIGDGGVAGTIHLAAKDGKVHLTGTIEGLSPGEHGLHVHEFGDLSNASDGRSVGNHFAPRGNQHGRPTDEQRHVGDLGNIEAADDGTATVDITDAVIALHGPHSILGRALVVHAGEDRFTQPTGDAGARVAFGVVGVSAAPK